AVRSDWPELVSILNKGLSGFSESDAHNIIRKWSYLPADRKRLELTEEEQAWLKEHPEIHFAFSADYPPALILDEDGRMSGMMTDVIDLLNQRLGSNFGITVAEINAVREMIANKDVAGQLALTAGNGAPRGLLETRVLWETYPVIYAPKDSPTKINALEDLKGKAVSTLKGSRYAEKILAPYQDKIDIVRTDTIVEAFRLLYEGRVDYMVGLTSQSYYLTKMRFLTLEPAFIITDHPTKIVMGVRDDWPKLVEILNKGLKSITADEWGTINGRWLEIPGPIRPQLSLTPEEQAWLSAHPKVSIAYPGGYPPYSFQDQQGRFKGISVDYVNEIARRTGLKLKVYPDGNWENLYSAALQREVDVVGGIIRRPERDEWFAFTKPYLSTAQYIITRKDQSGIRHRNDIAGKTIALVKGYATTRSLLEEFPTVKPYYVDNVMAAFEAVSLGHADACLGVMGAAQYFIAEKGIQNLRFAAMFSEEITDWRISVRKDWPVLQAIFDKALASISDDERHKIFLRCTSLEVAQAEAVKSVKGTLKLTDLEQAWIAEKHTVRVRIVNFPPYTILGQGKPTGIVPDYLKRITEQTGVEFELVEASSPYAEALRGLQNLEGPDVIPSIMFSPEERNVLFSNPYQASPIVFYTRADADFITSISDLIGKSVIVNKGTVIEQTLAREYPEVNLVYCRSAEQGVLRLA
ncbi:MAG: transporter substrate-binding domain-containing protein, partial [Desulfobacterales bacterium]